MVGPIRFRKNYCLVPVKLPDGQIEMHVIEKNSEKNVSFFSSDRKQTRKKTPFGNVREFRLEQIDQMACLVMKNRLGMKCGVRLDEFNPFLWGVNHFSEFLAKLRAQDKTEDTVKYLNLMVRSVAFEGHKPEKYSEMGFEKGNSALQDKDINNVEYEEFRNAAMQLCEKVENKFEVLRKIGGGKLKRIFVETEENSKEPMQSKKRKAEEGETGRRKEGR